MPTPPPPKVPKPKSKEERETRKRLTSLINMFFNNLNAHLYGYRSHPPCGFDYTTISEQVGNVQKLCKARPDWVVDCFEPKYLPENIGDNGLLAEMEALQLKLNIATQASKTLEAEVRKLRKETTIPKKADEAVHDAIAALEVYLRT